MSVKNYLEGVCVCVCCPVHYWPAAEASHFPVFIKTRPIKFYLQSIIRTPQINQRQLNRCFLGQCLDPSAHMDTPSSALALFMVGCGGATQCPPGLLRVIRQRCPLILAMAALHTVALSGEALALISLTQRWR